MTVRLEMDIEGEEIAVCMSKEEALGLARFLEGGPNPQWCDELPSKLKRKIIALEELLDMQQRGQL